MKKKQTARKAGAAAKKAPPKPPPEPVVMFEEDDDDLLALASGEAAPVDLGAALQASAPRAPAPPPPTAGSPFASTAAAPSGGSRGVRMPSASAVMPLLANPWAIFLGVAAFFVLFFLLARGAEGIAKAYLGISGLYGLAIIVWLLIAAFRDSVTSGLLCLCVPFYAVYFVLAKQDNPYLKALAAAAIISNICTYFMDPKLLAV